VNLVKVRCPTPTPRGSCNRWQFEVSDNLPDGIVHQYRCAHCKVTTMVWSSQLKREAFSGIR
jgi:hypothetical protein